MQAGVPSDQILNPHMEAVAMAKQLEMTTNALEATKAELAKIQAALAAAEANLGPGRVFALNRVLPHFGNSGALSGANFMDPTIVSQLPVDISSRAVGSSLLPIGKCVLPEVRT
jgi:hypothetical protein